MTYYHNADYAVTNMVESLLTARCEFTEDVIVSYSDILFSKEMLNGMLRSRDDFAVAVDTNWEAYWRKRYGRTDFDTESLTIGSDGAIRSLGLEDPDPKKIDARYVGLLEFSAAGLRRILALWERDYPLYQDRAWKQSGKRIRQAYMTDLLQALIEEGESVRAVKFHNGWIEFDTNEDYENACRWQEDGSLEDLIRL